MQRIKITHAIILVVISSITFTLAAAAVSSSSASSGAKTAQSQGLLVLSDAARQLVRYSPVREQLADLKKLEQWVIPPTVAPVICATAQPLQPFFNQQIDKTCIEHPIYGKLRRELVGKSNQLLFLEHHTGATFFLLSSSTKQLTDAYFIGNTIVVEYTEFSHQQDAFHEDVDTISSAATEELRTLFIDAATYRNITFATVSAQIDKKDKEGLSVEGTLGQRLGYSTDISGFLHLCSHDKRFIATPYGFIDLIKKIYVVLDIDEPLPLLPVYTSPDDATMLVCINTTLAFLDSEKLSGAVVYLHDDVALEGWADSTVLKKGAFARPRSASNALVFSHRDCNGGAKKHRLLVRPQVADIVEPLFQGMLTPYTLRIKSSAVADTAENLNSTLDILLDRPSVYKALTRERKENVLAAFVSRLVNYHESRNNCCDDMKQVKKDMPEQFTRLKEFSALLRGKKPTATLLLT